MHQKYQVIMNFIIIQIIDNIEREKKRNNKEKKKKIKYKGVSHKLFNIGLDIEIKEENKKLKKKNEEKKEKGEKKENKILSIIIKKKKRRKQINLMRIKIIIAIINFLIN